MFLINLKQIVPHLATVHMSLSNKTKPSQTSFASLLAAISNLDAFCLGSTS